MIFKLINKLRRLAIRRYRERRARKQCGAYQGVIRIGGPTSLTKNTFLGKDTNFNGLVISGRARVDIGSYFHSGPDCLFICQIHNFNQGNAIPYDATYIQKPIKIGDFVWLGSRVIVLGGVTIGEGAIVQAGSCVVSDIPPYAIAGGHPAKVFAYRDLEHFDKLKKAGKFH